MPTWFLAPIAGEGGEGSVNRSILKKSRHIGFGVFIVHPSMERHFVQGGGGGGMPAGPKLYSMF